MYSAHNPNSAIKKTHTFTEYQGTGHAVIMLLFLCCCVSVCLFEKNLSISMTHENTLIKSIQVLWTDFYNW